MSKLDELNCIFYNHDYKVQYLREYEEENRLRDRIGSMALLSEYENKLGKDLGEMTKEELLNAFSDYQISSYNMLLPRMIHLRNYLAWYSDNIAPLQSRVLNVTWRDVDLTDSFREYMLSSPNLITSDWIDFPPEDGSYIQPVMVLAWCGIQLKDAVKLKKSDVIDDGQKFCINTDTSIEITDPLCVAVLRAYRDFKSRTTKRRVWTPKYTDKFLYPLVAEKDKPDLRSIQISRNIYVVSVSRGDMMVKRYDNISVLNAGRYHRIIDFENEQGRPATINELRKMSGRVSLAKTQVDALRASVDTYRKAFKL